MIGQEATIPTELQYLVQLGGFGLAAYLVWWLTRKLNGKFDKLTESVDKLTDNIERLLPSEDYRNK